MFMNPGLMTKKPQCCKAKRAFEKESQRPRVHFEEHRKLIFFTANKMFSGK